MRRLNLFAAAFLSVAGCAIHVPMSESVMFGESKPPQDVLAGLGVSYTIIPTGGDEILAEAERRFETESGADIDPSNLRKQGFSVNPLWYIADRRAALSLSVGTMLGADVTIKMPADFYVTAVGTADGGVEGILQRSILQSRYAGLSVGAAYRTERHAFYVGDDEYPAGSYLGPDDWYTAHSLGLRISGLVFERDHTSMFLRTVVFAGYSPTFESPIIRFGLTTGAF